MQSFQLVCPTCAHTRPSIDPEEGSMCQTCVSKILLMKKKQQKTCTLSIVEATSREMSKDIYNVPLGFTGISTIPIQVVQSLVDFFNMDADTLVYTLMLTQRCRTTGLPFYPYPQLMFLAICIITYKLHDDNSVWNVDVTTRVNVDLALLNWAESHVVLWLYHNSSLFIDRDTFEDAKEVISESRTFKELKVRSPEPDMTSVRYTV